MNEILQETLVRMAVIAEHSLENVEAHIKRVREYAYLLARGLDMKESAAGVLADACMLHDVGMVAVPATVVRKATNLTNDEWEIIRQHPIVGSEFLGGSSHELFQIAKTVSLTHHERWDGSGYPVGLKQEDIPMAGRICGLCDVFDTLTHPRAYKRALEPDEVLQLLAESSESFFDPGLVELFTHQSSQILEIREKYP